MSRLAKAKRRIRREERAIQKDNQDLDAARKQRDNLNATEDDLRNELQRVRKWQDRRRESLGNVRDEMDEIEADGISDDEREAYDELQERREVLADKIDEGVALKQHLLERLDAVGDKQKDARKRVDKLIDERKEDWDDLKAAKKRRDKIKREQAASAGPSKNFSYAEFDCNDGTDLPEAAKPAVKDWCARIGEPLRTRFGSVHINSGFRHAAYNRAIGGASNSVHIYNYPGRDCKAVAGDVTCGGGSAADWYAFTAGKADGRGRYSSFHHADTRNRIGWPDSVWSG